MATPPAEAGGKAEMPAEARQEKSFSPRSSGLPGSLGSGRVGNMDSHYRRPNGLQPFLHKTAWRFALFLLLALAIRAFSTEAGIVDKEPPFNPQDFVRDICLRNLRCRLVRHQLFEPVIATAIAAAP